MAVKMLFIIIDAAIFKSLIEIRTRSKNIEKNNKRSKIREGLIYLKELIVM